MAIDSPNMPTPGNNTFESCHSLIYTIPSEWTQVKTYAFYQNYALQTITVNANITSIGTYAFASCTNMNVYHFQRETPPALASSSFNGIPADCIIYVPTASVDAYKAASGWSAHAAKIVGE